jgi:hypothetical protein
MSSDTTVVPDDHEVTVFTMAIEPGVHVTEGNVIIANLGVAGDDADRELDDVLAAVDAALAKQASAQLVKVSGQFQVSSLFAPNTPDTLSVRSPIMWVFHDGTVISTMASERRRAAVMEFMHRAAKASVPQSVYFIEPPEPAVALFAQHMIGLGVVMRQPDANQRELTILVEVKRPDGVYSVLAGTDIPLEGLEELYKPDALLAVPAEVLGRRLGKLEIKDKPLAFRSPRLRQRLIDLKGHSDETRMAALLDELLTRDLPLFLSRLPDSDTLEVRVFDGVNVLTAYADVISLHWAAADLKLAQGSYVAALVDPVSLIKQAATGKFGIAIGGYENRETPLYAVIPAPLVDKLATGLAELKPAPR